ncbi:MAG: hypothetical protein WED10_10580 [Brumimicrobium sp.]
MKPTIEIEKSPKKVEAILTALKKNDHFLRTFEGDIQEGRINGDYKNLTFINNSEMGYVKVTGTYNNEKGNMNLKTKPAVLYWVILNFSLIISVVLLSGAVTGSYVILAGAIFFFLLALLITFAYFRQVRIFKKRILNVVALIEE